MKIRIRLIFVLFLFIGIQGFSQSISNVQLGHMHKPSVRKEIKIPDIQGYKTLKCDFHMHTIFSDGIVWPTYRVIEAWEEGLDAIAITDHIENQPSKKYVGGDHNASYEIALPAAKEKGIILIRAGEITRSMPPGHLNAIFLEDVNHLDTPDPLDAIKAAKSQGAFIMWNHPGWKAQQPDTCLWMPMHQQLYEQGMIHGIEVFNEKEWYPIVLDWCIEKELAVIGNSDIHDVNAHYYDVENGHRPMTLVFAIERSREAIKKAMFEKRTVAFFDDKLAGKKELLKAIFNASVKVEKTSQKNRRDKAIYNVSNSSTIPFEVESANGETFVIPSEASVLMPFDEEGLNGVTIKNLYVGARESLKLNIEPK